MPFSRVLLLIALASSPLAVAAAEPPPCAASASASHGDPEIADIINSFSKRTGKKFILDARVRAVPGFAGIDPDKITYEQLLATLTVNQFASVQQGDFIVVVPDANARQLPTPVYTDANFKAADDEWVTVVLTPKKLCPATMVPVLRPLLPQAAHMAAQPAAGALLISDRAINVRRIAGLVDRLDKNATSKQECGDGGKSGS